MNYGQAVDFLMNIPKFTHEPGLEPAKMLLKLLGNPEKNKKIIHVAGTNGKGSVCAYMNSVLTKAGIKTGLFTSPHLVRIEERIRINGRMVSEEMFAEAFEVVFKCAEELEAEFGRLSFLNSSLVWRCIALIRRKWTTLSLRRDLAEDLTRPMQ